MPDTDRYLFTTAFLSKSSPRTLVLNRWLREALIES